MPIDKHEWPVLIVSGEFDAATDEGCRLRELKKQGWDKPIIGETTIAGQKVIELAGAAS